MKNDPETIRRTEQIDRYNIRFQTQQAFIYAGAYYGKTSLARFYEIQAALNEHEVRATVEKLNIAGVFHIARLKNSLTIFSIISMLLGSLLGISYFLIGSTQLAILVGIFLGLFLILLGITFFHYLTCPLIHFTILYRNFCALESKTTLFDENSSGETDDNTTP